MLSTLSDFVLITQRLKYGQFYISDGRAGIQIRDRAPTLYDMIVQIKSLKKKYRGENLKKT